MSISPITRNLRDAELVLIDGSSPANQITVLLDEGDLSWTEHTNTIEVKSRGSITNGHLRKGDDESVALTFSAKWTQLLGKSVDSQDPVQVYEFLNLLSGTGITSTSPDGQQQTLTLQFTVFDPAGIAHERITFEKVYQESLSLSEGDDYNLIAYTGRSFTTRPTVSRYTP